MSSDRHWYKNAIVYAVDVHRYQDSNGDGQGDFPGLTSRLDHLADLGVTCLWLLPFYPSPYRDNGYDVSDYLGIDPRVGTFDDFLAFLHAAGERSIRVIIDLVVEHTSDRHPWFVAARQDRNSRFRDYYSWSDDPPPVPPDRGSIFPGEEATVWTWDDVAGAYFYHRFYHHEPDLNMTNPAVREEIAKVMDFWLSFGISGFRIDAAPHMLDTAADQSWRERPHQLLKDMRALVERRKPGTMLLGEVDMEPEKLARFFGDDDELNVLFNFLVNNYMFLALARGEGAAIARGLKQLPALPPSGQWAMFVRNMDELDLERLSADERQEVLDAFAPDEAMRIFGRGIRRRVAPMLGGERRRLELVFSALLSLPGTPLIMYGDEIGMGEDMSLPGRQPVRAPMQWSAGKNGGFSEADADRLVQPAIRSGPFGYEAVNVEAQRADGDSFLNWMKRLIYTRRATPEFGHGTWRTFDLDADAVLAHRCAWKDQIVVAVHNFSGGTLSIDLDLRDQLGRSLQNLLKDSTPIPIAGDGTVRFELGPYAYEWLRVTGPRPM